MGRRSLETPASHLGECESSFRFVALQSFLLWLNRTACIRSATIGSTCVTKDVDWMLLYEINDEHVLGKQIAFILIYPLTLCVNRSR
jgi:hypothetical protein